MKNLKELFEDKSIKAKRKVEILSTRLIEGELSVEDFLKFYSEIKEKDQAICMEALERLSQDRSDAISGAAFSIAVLSLSKKHPGLKRESALVVSNTAHLYQKNLDEAIVNLLHNAEHRGTVVRWSSATALSTIVHLDIPEKGELTHALKSLSESEEKDSIKKIYSKGLNQLNEES